MLRLVALDAGPLGLLTHPKPSPMALACASWLKGISAQGFIIVVPSIVVYELRREFFLRDNRTSLKKLDSLLGELTLIEINEDALTEASHLWAALRKGGKPNASSHALDADCILVSQVRSYVATAGLAIDEWIIATADLGDIPRMAPAARWEDI